ncbi:hypothetical protein VCR15J2_460066 [Vibrio coralliirubri]|uniref:hypothetical protein n=1 Tax=Vibrio coralliirubri TaxID=1516159 RepID=UPI0006324762|nr:hypothetical protein [Vibrio coralliirubri]CDT60466.1 hypothetical protein VCR15J2_460066 [Vibrio coralliirubri]
MKISKYIRDAVEDHVIIEDVYECDLHHDLIVKSDEGVKYQVSHSLDHRTLIHFKQDLESHKGKVIAIFVYKEKNFIGAVTNFIVGVERLI